jgi:hypothetical protein
MPAAPATTALAPDRPPQKKKAGTASGLPRDAVNRDDDYDVWKRDQVTVTRAPTRARL